MSTALVPTQDRTRPDRVAHLPIADDRNQDQTKPGYRWVILAEHCRRTGETPQTVHTRRKRGIWLDGKHTLLATPKRLYVNVEEYNKWVESQLNCQPA